MERTLGYLAEVGGFGLISWAAFRAGTTLGLLVVGLCLLVIAQAARR